MADKSAIEWTDATWNPIRGCTRVSAGCQHCYAEGVAARFSGPGLPYEGLAKRVTRADGRSEARWTNEVAFAGDKVLRQPMSWSAPRKIFVNSMSDLFHENVPDEMIDRIFAVMALCPQHTFQILTKRPERMLAYLTDAAGAFDRIVLQMMVHTDAGYPSIKETCATHGIAWQQPASRDDWWPLRNVWVGVSVEDQAAADERIPLLLQSPAAKRFISAEPLLGPLNIRRFMWPIHASWPAGYRSSADALAAGADVRYHRQALVWAGSRYLDWVIVGGESGPGARPMHPAWARSLRDQCARAEVPFFFKQWGEWAPGASATHAQTGTERVATYYDESWSNPGWHFGEVSRRASEDMHCDDEPDLWRMGKKRAGRWLDGIQHNGFPEPRA